MKKWYQKSWGTTIVLVISAFIYYVLSGNGDLALFLIFMWLMLILFEKRQGNS